MKFFLVLTAKKGAPQGRSLFHDDLKLAVLLRLGLLAVVDIKLIGTCCRVGVCDAYMVRARFVKLACPVITISSVNVIVFGTLSNRHNILVERVSC